MLFLLSHTPLQSQNHNHIRSLPPHAHTHTHTHTHTDFPVESGKNRSPLWMDDLVQWCSPMKTSKLKCMYMHYSHTCYSHAHLHTLYSLAHFTHMPHLHTHLCTYKHDTTSICMRILLRCATWTLHHTDSTPYITGIHIHALILPTLLTHTCMHLYYLHYSHTHACTYQGRTNPGALPPTYTLATYAHTHTHTTNVTTPIVPLLRLRHVHSSPSERKANNKEHTKHYCTHTCIHTHSYMHTLTVIILLPFQHVHHFWARTSSSTDPT